MDQENQNIASSRHFQLLQGSGDVHLVTAMSLLACLVAFAAGYMTTEMGQHALKAAAAARLFPPIDIFACSVIASLFTVIAAGRFRGFQQCCSAFFIMLASSSVAHFILHHRPFAWLVYVPCGVHLLYVVPYNSLSAINHQLFTHMRNIAQLMWNRIAVAEIKMDTIEVWF